MEWLVFIWFLQGEPEVYALPSDRHNRLSHSECIEIATKAVQEMRKEQPGSRYDGGHWIACERGNKA